MSAIDPLSELPSSPESDNEPRSRWWMCWRRITLWWWLTLGLLLLSPVLGFFVTWVGIAVVTMATESGQSKWLPRLLLAPVMIFVARFSIAILVYYVAYSRGYWAAESAVARGEEHHFGANAFRGMWCQIDDPLRPDFMSWTGWRAGAHAGLPPHAGDRSFAEEFLTKKGATFAEDRTIVILEGDEFGDSDLKWLQTFGRHHAFHAIEINCSRVTDDGIRHLKKLHIEQLWLRRGQFTSDVREIAQELTCGEVWISFESINAPKQPPAAKVRIRVVPDRVAERDSPSLRYSKKPKATTSTSPPKPSSTVRQATATPSLTRRQFKELSPEERFARKWHRNQVRAVALSRDGKQVASGGDDRCVKVWNVSTRRVVWSQEAHASEVTSTWFSDDGSEVSSLSRDGELIVWNATSGERLRSRKFGDGNGRGMISALSPNGEFLALHGGNHPARLRVWRVASEDSSLLFDLDPQFSIPESMAISSDGTHVAMSSGRTQLIELKTGQIRKVEAPGHQRAVNFTPDGQTLATSPGPVGLFDLETLQHRQEISSYASWVRGINFSSNSDDIILGHGGGRITIGSKLGQTWTHLGVEEDDTAAARF